MLGKTCGYTIRMRDKHKHAQIIDISLKANVHFKVVGK